MFFLIIGYYVIFNSLILIKFIKLDVTEIAGESFSLFCLKPKKLVGGADRFR